MKSQFSHSLWLHISLLSQSVMRDWEIIKELLILIFLFSWCITKLLCGINHHENILMITIRMYSGLGFLAEFAVKIDRQKFSKLRTMLEVSEKSKKPRDVRTGIHMLLEMFQWLFQCSYYPACKSTHLENLKEVKEYRQTYGVPGESFQCFYNPLNHNEVSWQRIQLCYQCCCWWWTYQSYIYIIPGEKLHYYTKFTITMRWVSKRQEKPHLCFLGDRGNNYLLCLLYAKDPYYMFLLMIKMNQQMLLHFNIQHGEMVLNYKMSWNNKPLYLSILMITTPIRQLFLNQISFYIRTRSINRQALTYISCIA